jgi:glycosyltransferase involved in cell wall biosynthesis
MQTVITAVTIELSSLDRLQSKTHIYLFSILPSMVKESRIVIASILKPVDDTRMYEKIGSSLCKAGHDVHIIGHSGAMTGSLPENINVHRIGTFKRLSVPRAFAKWKVFFRTVRLRPSLFILCTHELLLPGILLKLFTGAKLIYDIQENYAFNIISTQAFPAMSRRVISSYVRFKERLYARFIDHFFLAEKSYERELPFIGKKFTVLQNKVKQSMIRVRHRRNDGTIVLLFTGTLDETTGIFDAIRFAEELHKCDKKVRLKIVGHAANTTMLQRIRQEINAKDFITLVGGDKLIAHGEIMTEIANADFGIVAYHSSPVTERKTPTKIFEYIASHLPIVLLSDNASWRELTNQCRASVSAHNRAATEILTELSQSSFYTENIDGIYWEEEKFKLLTAVKGLI